MTVDPKWIRNPSDTLAIAQGCHFDADAGRLVCDFIEAFCKQSKGKWGGQPIALLDWQRDLLMRLFGWKKPDGRRRYRRAYVEVAKKNGKSTLVAALNLYMLLADGENAPEIYLNACDREQARIIYDESARMVRSSPALLARLDVIDSKTRIVWPAGNGVIRANSSECPSKDGLNPSQVIFDELHRQPDARLWDIFEYAAAAREQPLTFSITTAGEDDSGVWFEQREYSEKVNAGVIPDTTHLGVVYRALPDDDLDDPATWRKANPSLGVTISEDDFRRELAEAKETPRKLAGFKRLRLNIISKSDVVFVPVERWDACNAPVDPAKLRRKPCWGGGDLSTTTDLTANALLFGDADLGFDLLMRFYLPEDNILELERRDRVPYRLWASKGFLVLTPGNVIDYGFVRRDLVALAGEYDLRRFLIDPFNAAKLAIELRDEDGLPVEFIRQGFLSLSAPTKELERLVLSGKLRHGGHPVLRWNASNAVSETDSAGNVKLSKKKSRLKIDGMAALVNAVAAMTSDPDKASVYNDRELILL